MWRAEKRFRVACDLHDVGWRNQQNAVRLYGAGNGMGSRSQIVRLNSRCSCPLLLNIFASKPANAIGFY